MRKRKLIAEYAAMLVVLVAMIGCYLYPDLEPLPSPRPTPPAPANIVSVADVTAELKGHTADAAMLAAYFDAFADVLSRDVSTIKTTGQIRGAVESSGKLMTQNSSYPGYPITKTAYEVSMKSELGMQDQPLDRDLRAKAVNVFRTMSRACQGAVR